MDQAGVHIVGDQAGVGNDRGVVHNDGVALAVTGAGAVAVDVAVELLHAAVLGNAAGHHVGRAVVAVQLNVKVGHGVLAAGGHNFFVDDKAGILCQIAAGIADGIVNAGDLHGFHLHLGALRQMHNGGGVHHLLAAPVALAVMLFDIAQLGVFGKVEGVDAVVLGIAAAAVVDAAAGNDGDVGAFPDVKVVVDQILQPGLAEDDGDVYALVLGERADKDINAGLVLLGYNVNVGGGVAPCQLAVGADVVSADRQAVEVGDLPQQVLFNRVDHLRTPSTLSASTLQAGLAASALPSRAGRMSARAPTFST